MSTPQMPVSDQAPALTLHQRQALMNPVSDSELRRQISQAQPSLTLYRGGRDFFTFQYNSHIFCIPPDLNGQMIEDPKTGKMVKADGKLEIRTPSGFRRDSSSGTLLGYDELENMSQGLIVKFAVRNHAVAGVTWLRNDGMDFVRMEQSRAKVMVAQKEWADGEVAARRAFTAKWVASNPGISMAECPRATTNQRDAQDYLDNLSDGDSVRGKYQCKQGCSDWDSFKPYAKHMLRVHNVIAEDEFPEKKAAPKPAERAAQAEGGAQS